MTEIYLPKYKKEPSSIPPINFKESDFKDDNERTLTVLYIKDGIKYYIDCKHSLCKTKYVFQEPELGIAYFDKETEKFIGSSLPIEEDYLRCLKRAIKSWKRFFWNFK